MNRILERPTWHLRTARWPTNQPLESLTTLVEPDRVVACEQRWYGWRERDQLLLYLAVGYGEAKAWVAAPEVGAHDHEIARVRALIPEQALEETHQVALHFWTWAGDGTSSYRRHLEAFQWEAIRDNYVGGTQAALDHLMRAFRPMAVANSCCGMGPRGRATRPPCGR